MIGIDTNILVRYLTLDDETQANIAIRIIKDNAGKAKSLFISNIVLCQLICVLERGYNYNKTDIISAIKAILTTIEFTFEHYEIIWLSLLEYEKHSIDFSNILIGKLGALHDCIYTITFDLKAATLKEYKNAFELPKNIK